MSNRFPHGIIALICVLGFAARGLAASPSITGEADPALAPFDILLTAFLSDHDVPGAAVAVAKDGRLVYARGFGLADKQDAAPVQPDSLFRIASISKPLTAVAVLRLVEQSKLHLDEPMLDRLAADPAITPPANMDERWRQITVRHLLQNRGGWDRSKTFDPMLACLPIAQSLRIESPPGTKDVIRFMLGRRLDFDPGERFEYSNFGYSVLGRLIEQASGQTYDEYVKQHVLAPLGVKRMQLGRTLLEHRSRDEVRYYTRRGRQRPAAVGANIGRPIDQPYGAWSLELMDAHGGWIASAVDLVRFAVAFDDPQACKLLAADSIDTMFARPPGRAGHEADDSPRAAFYACGWMVRPQQTGANTWHAGYLDGTSTLLVRRWDGLTWAVLFNSDASKDGRPLHSLIDPLMHKAANAVRAWPDEKNLFDHFK